MDPLMSPATADAALERGLITPDQHAQITGAPPPAPFAPPDATPLPEWSGGDAGVGGSTAPTTLTPLAPDASVPRGVDRAGRMAYAPGPLSSTAPPPGADMTPPVVAGPPSVVPVVATGALHEPRVDVGRITVAPPVAPPMAPVSGPVGASASPHGVAFYDPTTGAPVAPTPAERKAANVDPRVKAQAERDEHLEARMNAEREAGALREARAKELADQADANAKAIAAKDAENADKQREWDAQTDAKIAETNKQADDYAAKKVAPGRWWSNQSTGSKIVAVLSSAFGGFANGLSGGAIQNTALAQINRYIDADIHAQEADIATGAKSLEAKRGVVHDMMAMGQSRAAAVSSARIASLQNADQQAKAIAAKYDPKLESASTQAVLGGLQDRMTNEREALAVTLKQEAAARQAGAAAAAARVQKRADERSDKDFEHGATLAGIRNKGRELDIEEKKAGGGSALEQKLAQDAHEKQVSVDEANKQLDQLRENPVFDKLGTAAALAGDSGISQRVMPEATKTRKDVAAVNLQMVSMVNKLLKDNEGRIPPSTVEQLEKLAIHPGDTKQTAINTIEDFRRVVNALSRQSGSNAKAPDARPTIATTKPPGNP